MPLTALPTPAPSRADPANFSTRADALLTALPGLVTEINAELPTIQLAAANGTAAATAAANAATSAAAAATSAELAEAVAGGSAGDYPDLAPVLLCDFMRSKALDPRFTFTRASTATFIDANGLVRTALSNTPRFEHDPTTGRCLGLLLEPARTNLVVNSQIFAGAAWTRSGAGLGSAPVVTENAAVAPDGTTTAARGVFALNGGATSADISSITPTTLATVAAQPTVAAIWLKSNTSASYLMRLDFSGTVSDDANYPSAITVTTEWRRFEIRLASPADTSRKMVLRLRGTLGTSDSADILMWGGQQETASGAVFASSYIPTAGATVTRATDACSLGTAPFALLHNAREGTLALHIRWPTIAVSGPDVGVALSDNTANNGIRLRRAGVGATPLLSITTAGVAVADVGVTGANLTEANGRVGMAGAWKVDDVSFALNGNAPNSADTSATIPVVDRLFLGGVTGSQGGSIVERLMWFNKRLANPVLAALSRI